MDSAHIPEAGGSACGPPAPDAQHSPLIDLAPETGVWTRMDSAHLPEAGGSAGDPPAPGAQHSPLIDLAPEMGGWTRRAPGSRATGPDAPTPYARSASHDQHLRCGAISRDGRPGCSRLAPLPDR